MTPTRGLILFAAAFVAGIINSIAGGGTLVTFPVLIWIGLDPKVANATSTVALWPGLVGSLWGYRREMSDSRRYLWRTGLTSLLGGAVGTLLLILTPSETFARLVPFLILFATLLFAAQESISRRLPTPGEPHARWWLGAILLLFGSAIYGAYFGAGNGIMILAVLGLLGINDIHRANGLKMFIAICLNSVAVVGFSISKLVRWPEALLMAVGAIAGGYVGARIARRVGRAMVRRAVVVIGILITILMLWRVWF
ncbi:MAG TPA: sulfite exporter TauE/SafE family protein [Pyrinomonadaceae bacterium]|jgi:hypothetical protein